MPEQQSALPGVTNGDSYMYMHLHMDNNTPCFAGKDSYDNDDIVEEIASKRTRVEWGLATENNEEGDKPMATHAIVRCSVKLLQHH